jgi:hypothetical protein
MRAELDDLVAPQPAPDFRERLWERAAERDRVVARRWRATAIGATATAVAAISAAGVFAFGRDTAAGPLTYDQTRSCPVVVQGGLPVARLSAHSTLARQNNGQVIRLVAFAGFVDSAGHSLGGIGQAAHGYGFPDDAYCRKAAPIPLTRAGLPLYDVFTPGEDGLGSFDNGAACWTGARMTVRVRANVGKNEIPTSGTIVMRTGKKLRPVVYVEWAVKRVAVYMSADCHVS